MWHAACHLTSPSGDQIRACVHAALRSAEHHGMKCTPNLTARKPSLAFICFQVAMLTYVSILINVITHEKSKKSSVKKRKLAKGAKRGR
jgi:hypothetical protein